MDTLTISIEHIELRRAVAILHIRGRVDATSYLELIACAQAVYATGTRHLILDLQRVTQVSSAGLMALHSIGVMFRGGTPPDPESGWAAFHTIAEDVDREMGHYVKILNPQPQVRQVLDLVGFTRHFEIHAELEAALIAWNLLATYTETQDDRLAPSLQLASEVC